VPRFPTRQRHAITQRFRYLQARRYGVMTARLRVFFHQQAARVTARYLGTTTATLEIPVWMGRLWLGELKETQADALLPAEENRRLQIVMSPELQGQYLQSAQIASDLLGAEVMEPGDPRVRDYLSIAGDRITNVNDVTRQAVQDALVLGGERGYNQHQIAYGVDEPGEYFTGINDIVDQTYTRRADAIARTELAFASASATLDTYDESNVTQVEVSDGEGCGWTSHDDPELADGSIRDMEDAQQYPIAHPNCVRVFLPVFA
jgi:hypothetical protein